MKSQCWTRLLKRAVVHRGPMLEQSIPEGLHAVERTHTEAVHKELQPVGKTHAGKVSWLSLEECQVPSILEPAAIGSIRHGSSHRSHLYSPLTTKTLPRKPTTRS